MEPYGLDWNWILPQKTCLFMSLLIVRSWRSNVRNAKHVGMKFKLQRVRIAIMTNTEEQDAILAATKASKANLMISALAGTGKTSTLLHVERAVPRGAILYLVFNTDNALKAMSLDQLKDERKK